jgi:hypothetical protein
VYIFSCASKLEIISSSIILDDVTKLRSAYTACIIPPQKLGSSSKRSSSPQSYYEIKKNMSNITATTIVKRAEREDVYRITITEKSLWNAF